MIFSLFFFFYNREVNVSFEDKLKSNGYSDYEVAMILNKVPSNSYDYVLELGYDKSLIDILSSSDYIENNHFFLVNRYILDYNIYKSKG